MFLRSSSLLMIKISCEKSRKIRRINKMWILKNQMNTIFIKNMQCLTCFSFNFIPLNSLKCILKKSQIVKLLQHKYGKNYCSTQTKIYAQILTIETVSQFYPWFAILVDFGAKVILFCKHWWKFKYVKEKMY